MTTVLVPDGAKRPNDRKKSKVAKEIDAKAKPFVLTHLGESWESKPMSEVLTPGFVRKGRKLDDMDFQFTLLESLFEGQEKAIAALDDMTWDQFQEVSDTLSRQMGATPGE